MVTQKRRPTVRSQAEALAFYNAHTALAVGVVNTFLSKYPGAVSPVRAKEDLLTDALLTLWRCCEVFDHRRGCQLSTLAYGVIFKRLLTGYRRSSCCHVNGQTVPIPASVSLSEPMNDEGTVTLGERLPARSGGYGGMDGLSALLHRERFDQARRTWEAKPPSLRAKSAEMAAEVQAVFY